MENEILNLVVLWTNGNSKSPTNFNCTTFSFTLTSTEFYWFSYYTLIIIIMINIINYQLLLY